jgi:hypothetical protein
MQKATAAIEICFTRISPDWPLRRIYRKAQRAPTELATNYLSFSVELPPASRLRNRSIGVT